MAVAKAPYTQQTIDAFMRGDPTQLESDWLAEGWYVSQLQQLKVRFKDGYSCTVDYVSEELALSFINAASHGSWWHQVVLGPRYRRGRSDTAAMGWIDGV